MLPEDYIYSKNIFYLRKGKWRNCSLQIGVIRRCQDILVAILEELNEKMWRHTFVIYGYECNNDFVSLIGVNDIHLIKFETFELAPEMTEVLEHYVKDVSFKIQLKSCTISQSTLIINEWYTIHVQTNGICFTTENGTRLVTKWDRSNIGQCLVEDCALNIEILSKNGKSYYSFYRDERYLIEKCFKAIRNLKFEYPITKSEKFLSTPRRSGSVDLRGTYLCDNVKGRRHRVRTCSSSRADDTMSIDDSSPPSTPCSPSCIFDTTNEPSSSTKCYNHIDEKDEELMFQLDSSDSGFGSNSLASKANGYLISGLAQTSLNDDNNKRLVDLERFPYESDLKSQGKLSPDSSSHNSSFPQQTIYIHNPNVYDKSRNGTCYQTMDFIKHHRKTSSEANFVQHQNEDITKLNVSHSADVHLSIREPFTISSGEKQSNCSSLQLRLSCSNLSSDTHGSSKSKDLEENCFNFIYGKQSRASPMRLTCNESTHDYYNIKPMNDSNDPISQKYPYSYSQEEQYYNLAHSPAKFPQSPLYQETHFQDVINNEKDSDLCYIELDFQDKPNEIISKKSTNNNYAEINHDDTEILKDIDDHLHRFSYKKKKTKFWKHILKK